MLARARGALDWFVGGLAEALGGALDRARPPARLRVELGGADPPVLDGAGRRLGALAAGDGGLVLAPPGLAARLSGSALDLVVPPPWMARRDLDPVAAASRPFLDAFARHQIERVTPWRVGDAHYRVLARPLPGDPGRLSVGVAVVPRRLVAAALAAVEPCRPRLVRLRAADDAEGAAAIEVGAGGGRRAAALRRAVVWALAAAALLMASLAGVLEWQAGAVRDDIANQDRVLEGRQALLARERRAADPGGAAAARLRGLRAGRPAAVAVVDALSAALPDSAHLTSLSLDRDRVTIAGVSADPSSLVPALETSGDFAEVAFGAATARAPSGPGDTFTLEMRALPPRSDRAGAPGAAHPARPAP